MENTLYLELETSTLEVKQEGEEGLFEGFLSVMNTPDQGKDIVLPGAFKASLEAYQKKGEPVPLLWQHDKTQPIGVMYAAEEKSVGNRYGLFGKFKLVLGVQKAKEAYLLLKAKAIKGLSFGYRPLEVDYDAKGHRLLKSVDFREGSLVTFPMHQEAEVMAVKGALSFSQVLQLETARRDWWQIIEALKSSLDSIAQSEGTEAAKLEMAQASIREFAQAAYQWFVLVSSGSLKGAEGLEHLHKAWMEEVKAGRMLSAVNKRDIAEAIRILQDLLTRAEQSEKPLEADEEEGGITEEEILKALRDDMQSYALMGDIRTFLGGSR